MPLSAVASRRESARYQSGRPINGFEITQRALRSRFSVAIDANVAMRVNISRTIQGSARLGSSWRSTMSSPDAAMLPIQILFRRERALAGGGGWQSAIGAECTDAGGQYVKLQGAFHFLRASTNPLLGRSRTRNGFDDNGGYREIRSASLN